MGEVKIRFAEKDDITAIMAFIDRYWKKDHILARDRDFFEWQYIHYDRVCFVLGENASKRIEGILGFIPYDRGNKKNIAFALWKSISEDRPFLGMELLQYLLLHEPHQTAMAVGINPKTTDRIYKRFGFEVGTMRQWYRLAERPQYQIAQIKKADIPEINHARQFRLVPVTDKEQLEKFFNCVDRGGKAYPEKSLSYLKKRYFNHPQYQYLVYAIDPQEERSAIVVLRVQPLGEANALRFVDYIGSLDFLSHITSALDKLLVEHKAEYIDLYETGVSEDMLLAGGWLRVDDTENIIPNYFSPFERRNVTMYYSETDKMVMFRGDGDQDRPN